MKTRSLIVTALFAMMLAATLPSQAATVSTTAAGFTFAPPVLRAFSGNDIQLQNREPANILNSSHTLTLDNTTNLCVGPNNTSIACDTGLVSRNANGSFTLKSTTKGNFTFHCLIHPWMTGLLVVQ